MLIVVQTVIDLLVRILKLEPLLALASHVVKSESQERHQVLSIEGAMDNLVSESLHRKVVVIA